MTEQPDLRDLLGGDVPEPELERLRQADAAMRSTPPPPEVPDSLTIRVLAIPGSERWMHGRRRALAGLAAAAVFAGAMFGVGFWLANDPDGSPMVDVVTLNATPAAPAEAKMVIEVLPKDSAGNWAMSADVTGLPALPNGAYYEVWLTKGEKIVAACGRFIVDESGAAQDVWLNAPYKFKEYDRWVVTAHGRGQDESRLLLDGPVASPV